MNLIQPKVRGKVMRQEITPPEDRHVHDPLLPAASEDECLSEDIAPPGDRDQHRVAAKVPPGEERLPARLEVPPGGRSSEPERVSVDDRRQGEHCGHRVPDQRGVEVSQPARSHVDEHEQH